MNMKLSWYSKQADNIALSLHSLNTIGTTARAARCKMCGFNEKIYCITPKAEDICYHHQAIYFDVTWIGWLDAPREKKGRAKKCVSFFVSSECCLNEFQIPNGIIYNLAFFHCSLTPATIMLRKAMLREKKNVQKFLCCRKNNSCSKLIMIVTIKFMELIFSSLLSLRRSVFVELRCFVDANGKPSRGWSEG